MIAKTRGLLFSSRLITFVSMSGSSLFGFPRFKLLWGLAFQSMVTCIIFANSASVTAETTRKPAEKPNLVLIMADDLGYSELGCYGQKIIRTPHLDGLAAGGIRFTEAYSGQAVCAPARCALMTGRHMGHAAIRDNANPPGSVNAPEKGEFPGQLPLPDSTVTIAEVLKNRGYATAGYGKWGLGNAGTTGDPLRQGFDDFGGFLCQVHAHNHYPRFLWKGGQKINLPGNDRTLKGESYSQDFFVKWGKEFIRAHQDGPFFLYLPFAVPHLSIQVPDQDVAEYTGIVKEADYVHNAYLQHPTPRAAYAAMITHMDRGIGEILTLLDDLKLSDNTLVIFTSDNGPTYDRLGGSDSEYFRSSNGFRGLKGSLYEGGIRVPLIAKWPGRISAGQTSDHACAFYDLFPTLCEVSGTPVPPDTAIDGLSFAPLFTGAPQKPHDFLYWEFSSYGGQQAVRKGNWKGIRQGLNPARKKPEATANLEWELYDLANDPGETKNVAAGHPEVVAEIRAIAKGQHQPSPTFRFPVLDRGE